MSEAHKAEETDQVTAEVDRKPIPDAYSIPLEDIDMINPRLFQENKIWEYFKRLREEDPVHLNEREEFGRYWSLTKFDDIFYVDKHSDLFSSARGITIGFPVGGQAPEGALPISTFIAMDAPKHDIQRATVSPIVEPQSLAKMEGVIRERTQKVLDSLPLDETFDWVDKVSIELTTQMLATLFDFPFDERRKLTRWSDVATAAPGSGIVDTVEQRREELLECLEYFTKLWNERVKNPGHDLVTMLAHGKDTKDMQPFELLGNIILLIVGGNDTTRNSMSGGVLALNEFPDEYQKLRDKPALIPSMVSEIIRWQTPLAYMRRTANEDVVIRDKQILKGDQLLMWYVSGNRDEDSIPEANKFIIDRKDVRRHLSFGFGIHRCMGNRLAEMQLRVLWEEILERFDKVEVVGEPERTFSSFVKGYTYLPVRLHKRA